MGNELDRVFSTVTFLTVIINNGEVTGSDIDVYIKINRLGSM